MQNIQKDIRIYCSTCRNMRTIKVKHSNGDFTLSCGHHIEFNIEGGQWSSG